MVASWKLAIAAVVALSVLAIPAQTTYAAGAHAHKHLKHHSKHGKHHHKHHAK